jgi:hypothetical protein
MSRPTFDDFPRLYEKDLEADQAAELLTKAAGVVTALAPAETWLGKAERLRGAASYAESATHALREAIGWYEAAHAAAESGVLDEGRYRGYR